VRVEGFTLTDPDHKTVVSAAEQILLGEHGQWLLWSGLVFGGVVFAIALGLRELGTGGGARRATG